MMTVALAALAALVLAGAMWLLALRGGCRRGVALPRPPFVLIPLILGTGALAHPHPAALALVVGTIVAGAVDARTGYIFHELTAGIMLTTCAAAIIEGGFIATALAAIAFAGILALVAITYAKLRGHAGLGLPDIALVGCMALGLGAWYGYIAVVAAFTLGAVYAVIMALTRGTRALDEVRFGPFLAGGTLVGTLAQTFALPGVLR